MLPFFLPYIAIPQVRWSGAENESSYALNNISINVKIKDNYVKEERYL